ncbi:MAG: TonB family protein [bacterium]
MHVTVRSRGRRRSPGPIQGCGMEYYLTVWQMADVGGLYAQTIDAARLALSTGDRPAAADAFHSAIDLARSDSGLERELASTLVQLGKLEQELGRPTEAQRHLVEALEVGERLYGAEHSSLGPVLNELSRLYIRQSDHRRAEQVLERLLGITRAKGEEHPDVATALAGLAVAKRGLGDDAAAEQRFRDALRIREKVLAPNHMATVVTMEQLSETCAARGNVVEALALLRRALPTREAALGADHATVTSLRSRIAALELRAAPPIVVAPVEAPPRGPNDLVFIYQPEPPAPRRTLSPRERMATPTYSAAVAAASLMASPIQMAPPPLPAPSAKSVPSAASTLASRPAASERTATRARASIPTPVADMVITTSPRDGSQPWAKSTALDSSVVPSDVVRAEVASAPVAPVAVASIGRESASEPLLTEPAERSSRTRIALYASTGAAVVALAIGGLTYRSGAGAGRNDVSGTPRAAAVVTSATTNAATALGAASMAAVVRPDSLRAVAATPAPIAPIAPVAQRAPQSATPQALPGAPVVPGELAAVNIPIIATTNVDSMVRASTKVGRESYTDQMGTTSALRASSATEDATVRPPVLIGPAPLPRFPDELRSLRTEGEVVVRFRVDEHGRVDVSSMKVVKSDHELFTAAVRTVLPRFRFEPARSPGPESKPRADWVDFRAEFTTKN